MAEGNSEAGDIVLCPSCQKIWPKGTKFCTQCGTWIETGEVMEPKRSQSGAGAVPAQGLSPPGIGPSGVPSQGPSPPGIAPTPTTSVPGQGPSPPGISPTPPGGVPSQGPTPPGVMPTQGPPPGYGPGEATRSAGDAMIEPGVPPQGEGGRKYRFKAEPAREERLPTSPVFVPKRERKKSRGAKPGQVVLVIIALLAIAYAVISLAFKPLHRFMVGTLCQALGKSELAIKYYERAAGGDSTWAEKSQQAMNKIGRKVLARHIELQYTSSWTASSTISIVPPRGKSGHFESKIVYEAPGKAREQITGDAAGGRILTSQRYALSLAGVNLSLSFEQYAGAMRKVLGFGPDALFEASGTDKVLDAFFDTLGTKLMSVSGSGDEAFYTFVISIDGDSTHDEELQLLSGPLFPWSAIVQRYSKGVSKVYLDIQAKDGFLKRIEYNDESGTPIVIQKFEDFKPGVE